MCYFLGNNRVHPRPGECGKMSGTRVCGSTTICSVHFIYRTIWDTSVEHFPQRKVFAEWLYRMCIYAYKKTRFNLMA